MTDFNEAFNSIFNQREGTAMGKVKEMALEPIDMGIADSMQMLEEFRSHIGDKHSSDAQYEHDEHALIVAMGNFHNSGGFVKPSAFVEACTGLAEEIASRQSDINAEHGGIL